MIAFLAPGFLLAGAVAALVPLVLHMLTRTPPERRPLPTARFLTADHRTRLRLRAPTHRWHLALRMLLLALLGTAFARPEWRPVRGGHQTVVLLDAGSAMASVWEAAVDAASARVGPGGMDGTLVVFDTGAAIFRAPTGALLDSLRGAPPAAIEGDYLAAMRGLRLAAATLDADSATAALITRPRWGAWSPAFPDARVTAWPASIELIDPAGRGPAPADVAGGRVGSEIRVVRIVALSDHPLLPYLHAALGALGHRLADGATEEPAAARGDVAVVLGGHAVPAGSSTPAVLVVLGAEATPAPLVWDESAGPAGETGRIVLPDGGVVNGWRRLPGRPAGAARVVAVWDDGRPAAAASRTDDGCAAYLAAEPAPVAAAADPAFPRLLAALLAGCDERPSGGDPPIDGTPLDDGATRVLRGDGMAPGVRLAQLGAVPARPLVRHLLALALLVAVVETGLAYKRPRSR